MAQRVSYGVHTACISRTYGVDTSLRARIAAGFAAVFVAALLTHSPASAATFVPPQGCNLHQTAQLRGCVAAQYFTCSKDTPGDQWVTYFDQEGARFTSRIDKETRWMESINLRNGIIDLLEPQAADHASFSTLIETGRDDFDFRTLSSTGELLRNIGEDQLTGESVVIDGVPLELTRFTQKVFAADGTLLIERTGQQFISREHGQFYGGVEESRDWTGEHRTSDDSPVTFAFPGEAGFGSTEPVFDCDMQMVLAPVQKGNAS